MLALIGQPEIAVLDELTTGLDPEARRDTWRLIERVRDRGVTIVLVTHLMEEAERLCDRVALIDHGRVIALDRPAALASSRVDGQAGPTQDRRTRCPTSCSGTCPKSARSSATATNSSWPAPVTW